MIQVIYETPDFMVIDKPAGMLVHHAKLKVESFRPRRKKSKVERENLPEKDTVADWVLENYPEVRMVGDNPEERPGIVHRLDKETSGVLIIAKTQNAFEELKLLFQKGQIKKTYKALVWGELRGKGVIDKPIGLRSGSVKRSARAKNMKMVKPAITEYESLEVREKNGEKFSLLNVFPETGRTHQIRVHLQSIHHPVVGDALYGPRKNPLGLARQFLHAEAVEFFWGKDGERLRIESDPPEDLQVVLRELKRLY